MGEVSGYVASSLIGLLGATWGMVRLINGRLRKLETCHVSPERVRTLELSHITPEDCRRHVEDIQDVHREMWADLKAISKAVARIEGHLEIKPD